MPVSEVYSKVTSFGEGLERRVLARLGGERGAWSGGKDGDGGKVEEGGFGAEIRV